ncbi:hypothetical protein GCM10019016_132920 [Streptomyces prasinosporus]|uniref:Uncharacterized protein n=1 Tax=Streptomyces prasinosporus TaxID=68256 RepID=A0ABP6UEY4_9ACTN
MQRDGAAASGEQHGARVPGVPGGGAEERLGVGDEVPQMLGEQPGAPGRPVPQGRTAAVRRGGRRDRPRGEGGEREGAAQGQCPPAQSSARDASRPFVRHEVPPVS